MHCIADNNTYQPVSYKSTQSVIAEESCFALQVASALCASYIGGSVNFAAVSQSLGLTPGQCPIYVMRLASHSKSHRLGHVL